MAGNPSTASHHLEIGVLPQNHQLALTGLARIDHPVANRIGQPGDIVEDDDVLRSQFFDSDGGSVPDLDIERKIRAAVNAAFRWKLCFGPARIQDQNVEFLAPFDAKTNSLSCGSGSSAMILILPFANPSAQIESGELGQRRS